MHSADICDQCQIGQICTVTKLYECDLALTTITQCPAPTVNCSEPPGPTERMRTRVHNRFNH